MPDMKDWTPRKPKPNYTGGDERAQIVKNKGVSQAQEKRLADLFRMRLQPGSGNLAWRSMKNDLRDHVFQVEVKHAEHNHFIVAQQVLSRALAMAQSTGRIGVLAFTLEGMPSRGPKDFVVLPAETFAIMAQMTQQAMEAEHESDP